jgi:hypothetical protein
MVGLRKTKCSGKEPECRSCIQDGVKCHYSLQKRMGRPRKRRRNEVILSGQVSASTNLVSHIPEADGWSFLHESPPSAESAPIVVDPLLSGHEVASNNLDSVTALEFVPTANSCSCILILTSNLTRLNSLSTFHFPRSLNELQSIISSTYTALICESCPLQRVTGFQNVSVLLSVLGSLVERFRGLLAHVNFERDRLLATGGQMPIRIGDATPENFHYHTGTKDCPMAINLFMDGAQWAKLALGAVEKAEKGPGPSLRGLIDDFEARQKRWHADPKMKGVMMARDSQAQNLNGSGSCLALLSMVRLQMEALTYIT